MPVTASQLFLALAFKGKNEKYLSSIMNFLAGLVGVCAKKPRVVLALAFGLRLFFRLWL